MSLDRIFSYFLSVLNKKKKSTVYQLNDELTIGAG